MRNQPDKTAIDPGIAGHPPFGCKPILPPGLWRTAVWYLPDTLRYLYLMRFSLILWLSMLVLAWADIFTSTESVTRGILTPFSYWQYIFSGFAVVLPGWFALLAARIVCAYGPDRFGVTPPPWFKIEDRMEAYAFWGAQFPGGLLLLRIWYNVVHEGERGEVFVVLACLLTGAFSALLFWYIISILYYWIWDPEAAIPVRAFLVPHWHRVPLDEIQEMPCGSTLRVFSRFMNWLGHLGPGYCARMAGQPQLIRTAPGHIVATLALVIALVMYLLLMPISAPVPVPALALVGRIGSTCLALYIVTEFILPAWKGLRHPRRKAREDLPPDAAPESDPGPGKPAQTSTRARVLPLLAALIMLSVIAFGIRSPHAPHVIPVIAYVVVLLTVVFWTLAGIAFYADHFRLPVITVTTALILLFNKLPGEHVFPVYPIDRSVIEKPLDTPSDFVNRIAFHKNDHDDEPVIVITATGGGIHAAAWTATVLRALDRSFRAQNIRMTDHILLMSSVSGGSVATAGFLREYFTGNRFDNAAYDRVQATAACSSLQAVAWGLTYPDTLRLVFSPVFDLFKSLDRFDRGWALQKAIDRNLQEPGCGTGQVSTEALGPSLDALTLDRLSRLDPTQAPCLGNTQACDRFPAFTLNTTVVETGDRFLLSNYSVFAGRAAEDQVMPAASFLGVYGRRSILPINCPEPTYDPAKYADISLLTAARLSATFTYVSPAARLPFEDALQTFQNAFHFVDGGYFDNDGTNSAIEFLKAASRPPINMKNDCRPLAPATDNRVFYSKRPLRVLLIEIRNTYDLVPGNSPDAYQIQAGMEWDASIQGWHYPSTAGKRRFGPFDQMAAPPEAAINAGFGSTTLRNRRELDTLQQAFCGSLELKRFVIDYQPEMRNVDGTTAQDNPRGKIDESQSELHQPLSWHLTARQNRWISGLNGREGEDPDDSLNRKRPGSARQKISAAVTWFQGAQAKGKAQVPIDANSRCTSQTLPDA